MTFDPHAYTISICRKEIDGQSLFEATIREFSDVREYADSHSEAYDLAIDTIEVLRNASNEEGWKFPAPTKADQTYSGRVTLRMPKWLHHRVAIQADQEGVSLNTLICTVLASASGPTPTASAAESTELKDYFADIKALIGRSSPLHTWASMAKDFETFFISSVHEGSSFICSELKDPVDWKTAIGQAPIGMQRAKSETSSLFKTYTRKRATQ